MPSCGTCVRTTAYGRGHLTDVGPASRPAGSGVMMPLMEVADGIYKVDGVRIANVYLVTIEDGIMLVDSGMPGNAKRILAFVERLGRQPRELRYVCLLYTSDAADDLLCVDLGGRRIIKKKKKKTKI